MAPKRVADDGWWLTFLESNLVDPKYTQSGRSILQLFARTITAGQIDLQFEPVFTSSAHAPGSMQPVDKTVSLEAFVELIKGWLERAGLLHIGDDTLVTLATDSSLTINKTEWHVITTCAGEEDIPPQARPEVRHVNRVMEGRTFFVTDSGHMGICSMWASEGDIVGIPFGASTPFVFGPRDDTENGKAKQRVSLVGDCYVEGVMRGEAFQQPDITRVTFVVE